MEHELRFFDAIDWATEEHQVYVFDDRRKSVGGRVVKHSGTAIAELAEWLAKLGDPASIAVAIEPSRGAVVEIWSSAASRSSTSIRSSSTGFGIGTPSPARRTIVVTP